MVKQNCIPRTLKGIGGKRYFDVPGVIYPKDILKAQPGLCRKSGRPYTDIPSWGITTYEAARLLSCSASAARLMLRRKKITFRIVKRDGSSNITYWKKDRVEKLADLKPPIVPAEEVEGLLSTQQAAKILRIGRSTIQRAMKAGKLHSVIVRIDSAQGLRKRCYLRKSEIQKILLQRKARLLREIACDFSDDPLLGI